MGPNYFPNHVAGQLEFTVNFHKNFPIHAPNLGFSPEEIAAIGVDTAFAIWYLQYWCAEMQKGHQESIAFAKHITCGDMGLELNFPSIPTLAERPPIPPAGIYNRLFITINRLKIHPNYQSSVTGEALWLNATPKAKLAHPFPTITMQLVRGPELMEVHIAYKKYGHACLVLESKVSTGEWTFLALTDSPPYIDSRPLQVANIPEIRSYRARWWDKNEAHGDWSPPQSITVDERKE